MFIIGDIHDPSIDSEERVLKPNTDMLRSLFGRSWFSRIWVLQEVAMAWSAAVNCGHKSLGWDVFRTFGNWNIVNRWLEKLPFIMLYEREKERLSKYFSEDELLKIRAENDLVKKFVET